MEKLNIFIGFDSSNYGQELAFEVCKRSIENHHLSNRIIIHKLVKQELIEKGFFYRKDSDGSTEFTYTRFLVPYISNFKGYSLFCDSDFLWCCDIQELFNKYIHPKKALACVKHDYKDCHGKIKMDGQVQEYYPKKNWSSLMIFNNEHPSTMKLSLDTVNNQTPKWLHRFEWTTDEDIIEIPKAYNYLVGYYNTNIYNALHFTDGGPWHPGYENVSYGGLWLDYLKKDERNKMEKLRINNYTFED
jgi:hypothetical protein